METFDVDEDAHHFGNGQRRVRVVELQGHLVGESVETGANRLARAELGRLEAADDVLNAAASSKIKKKRKRNSATKPPEHQDLGETWK